MKRPARSYQSRPQLVSLKLLLLLRDHWLTAADVAHTLELSHKTANAYLQNWAAGGLLDTRLRTSAAIENFGIVPSEYHLKRRIDWPVAPPLRPRVRKPYVRKSPALVYADQAPSTEVGHG